LKPKISFSSSSISFLRYSSDFSITFGAGFSNEFVFLTAYLPLAPFPLPLPLPFLPLPFLPFLPFLPNLPILAASLEMIFMIAFYS
jgi:hypothetical protein